MEEIKISAQISKKTNSSVERLGGSQKTPFLAKGTTLLKTQQLRRKSVQLSSNELSKLSRILIQNNFEALAESGFYEYESHTDWSLNDKMITITNKILDGHTVADQVLHRDHLNACDLQRLRQRLYLWARAFDKLSQWHELGVIHGNIKPSNILVCENLNDEFMKIINEASKKDDSAKFIKEENFYVILLDGGYLPHLESTEPLSKINTSFEDILEKRREVFWWPSDILNNLDGIYSESSDIFSMAAVAAWDLGFFDQEDKQNKIANLTSVYGVMSQIWPLFVNDEPETVILGKHKLRSIKNTALETLRRIKSILASSLSFIPHKRTKKANELAAELMVLVHWLNNIKDNEDDKKDIELIELTTTNVDLLTHEIVTQKNNLPLELLDFIFSKPKNSKCFWLASKSTEYSVHEVIKNLCHSVLLTKERFLFYRVRYNDDKYPFAAINIFITNLILELKHSNYQEVEEVRNIFSKFGTQLVVLAQAVPSIMFFIDQDRYQAVKQVEEAVYARHESLHHALDYVLRVLINFSKISLIIIDDFHRVDNSSFDIFNKILSNKNELKAKWILGIRSYEIVQNPTRNVVIEQMMKGNSLHYVTDLAIQAPNLSIESSALNSEQIRLLSAWSVLSNKMTPSNMEYICLHAKEIENLLSCDYYNGKTSKRDRSADFIGNLKDSTSSELLFDNNQDIFKFGAKTIFFAKKLGLLVEERDPISGYLTEYQWKSSRIALVLNLLLNFKLKKEINILLIKKLTEIDMYKLNWSQLLGLSEILLNTDLNKTNHATFRCLMLISENILDLHSLAHVIDKFQCLADRLDRQQSKEVESLIPRIRERIGDLMAMLRKRELAFKYYDSVALDTTDPKRKAVLAAKSWFPDLESNRQKRNEIFKQKLQAITNSKLIPYFSQEEILDPNKYLLTKIYEIKSLLDSNAFLHAMPKDSASFSFLLSFQDTESSVKTNFLPYAPRAKAIRETVLTNFIRKSLGWIDSKEILATATVVLDLSIKSADKDSIIQAIINLLLCFNRKIKTDIRIQALDLAIEIAMRHNDDIVISEIMLYNAWSAYFIDGDLINCRRALDSLKARAVGLPLGIKRVMGKLLMMFEYENKALEKANLDEVLLTKIFRDNMEQYAIESWPLGALVLGKAFNKAPLCKVPDEDILSSILAEQMDQILLYSSFCIENGYFNAANIVAKEAKNTNCRDWFSDPDTHLFYLPRAFGSKITEKRKNITSIRKLPKFDPQAKQNFLQDPCLLGEFRYELMNSPEPERLSLLAELAIEIGLLWTASRICQKLGTTLTSLIHELKEQGSSVAAKTLKNSILPVDLTKKESGQAVALNFILEFIYNLQLNVLQLPADPQNEFRNNLASCLQKSVPPTNDLIEETISQAVNSAVRKIVINSKITFEKEELM